MRGYGTLDRICAKYNVRSQLLSSPHPFELTFENATGTYDALWAFGGTLADDPKIGNPKNWLLTFRRGLRGMHARLITIDSHYLQLHQFLAQAKDGSGLNPNQWGMKCESHAAVILFGMDSMIECFVFALNAIGFLKSPADFCDITDTKALRQINPKNIACNDPADHRNPRVGYRKFFPGVVSHWKAHEILLSTIFEYHDVSKHRAAVVTGGDGGAIYVLADPKLPDSHRSSPSRTFESLVLDFQRFVDELLPLALEETAAAFGYTATKKILHT